MCDCYDWELMEQLETQEEEARQEEITVKVKPKKVNQDRVKVEP